MELPSTRAGSRWLWALRISTLACMLPLLFVAIIIGPLWLQHVAWTGRLLLILMVPCSVIAYLLILWRLRGSSPRKSGIVVALGIGSTLDLFGVVMTVGLLVSPKNWPSGGQIDWGTLGAIVFYWLFVMAPHTALLAIVLKTNRMLRPPLGSKRIFVLDAFLAFGCFIAFIVILTLLTLSV